MTGRARSGDEPTDRLDPPAVGCIGVPNSQARREGQKVPRSSFRISGEILEARPETPSRLQIANEAQSVPP